MAQLGRKAANEAAGEEIPFHNDKKKVKDFENIVPHNQKLVAPLFNLVFFALLMLRLLILNFFQVDDSKSTLVSIGTEMTAVFGTTFGFQDFLTTTIAKV